MNWLLTNFIHLANAQTITISNPLGEGATLETLLDRLIDFFAYQLGPVVVVAMIVWAGWQFITAGGDEGKIKTARSTITYTVIGYAVILIADGAVSIIKSALGIETSGGKTATDLVAIFSNLVDWFFYITVIASLAAILYAAWLFISSGGDAKKQEQARSVIVYAIIGLAIAMLAEVFIIIAEQLVGVDQSSLPANPSGSFNTGDK